MIQLISQGGGFYGLALFTTDKSIDEVREVMTKLGWAFPADWRDVQMTRNPRWDPGFPPDGAFTAFMPSKKWDAMITVSVADPDLQAQPVPVVVFDTGNAADDKGALMEIFGELVSRAG